MESALDVLSRAAIMVQDNASETRLTSKELPTAAWRRERRLRAVEYHHPHHHPSPGSSASNVCASSPNSSPPPTAHVQQSSISSGSVSNNTSMCVNAHHIKFIMTAAANIRTSNESTNHPPSPPTHSNLADQIHLGEIAHSQVLQHLNSIHNDDAPLDMSVGNLKQRNSPPPPYREPLPGSHFASSLARPSVITQAPPKRDSRDVTLLTNRENDNRSCESIDEHFRRSLGNDYFSLFSKRSPANQSIKSSSPQPHNSQNSAQIKSTSPTLPLPSGAPTLLAKSTYTIQSELIPPPAYPVNLPSGNYLPSSQQAQQNQILATPKVNNVLLSPAATTAQMKITEPNSPPLPLVVRPNILQNHPHCLFLQKSSSIATTPLTSPKSPAPNQGAKLSNTSQSSIFNSSGSRTTSPLPLQQSSAVVVNLAHLVSVDNSALSSPRHTPPVINVPVSNPSPNLPAIIRIKTEPGLQNIKSNNPTPPASPTLTINHNINSNSTSSSSNTSSPSSPKTSSWKPSLNATNTSADVLASVDDHFAKALGDTWKKLQESKEIRE